MKPDQKLNEEQMKSWYKRHNVGYKVVALVLSLLLWYYVAGQRDPVIERSFSRPVSPRNLSSQMMLSTDLSRVSITLHGLRSLISTIKAEDVIAYVDLTNLGAGDNQVPVKVEAIYGVEIKGSDPKEIRVSLDTYVEKKVPVRLTLQGAPATGFTLQTPVISPPIVLVSGPSNLIDRIQEVDGIVAIAGASNSINQRITLQLAKSLGNRVKLQPGQVKVLVPVVVSGPAKTVSVVVEVQGTPAQGYTLKEARSDPSTVQLSGKLDVIAAISVIHTKPVDISGVNADIIKETTLELPVGVTLMGQNKAKVSITITPVQPVQLQKQ